MSDCPVCGGSGEMIKPLRYVRRGGRRVAIEPRYLGRCPVCGEGGMIERARAEEREAWIELANKVEIVIPYVVATLPSPCDLQFKVVSPRTGKTMEDWGGCHKGRAGSSIQQLKGLRTLAAAIRARTK